MRTRGQDAHVNTPAAANSGAPPDGAGRADHGTRAAPVGRFRVAGGRRRTTLHAARQPHAFARPPPFAIPPPLTKSGHPRIGAMPK